MIRRREEGNEVRRKDGMVTDRASKSRLKSKTKSSKEERHVQASRQSKQASNLRCHETSLFTAPSPLSQCNSAGLSAETRRPTSLF